MRATMVLLPYGSFTPSVSVSGSVRWGGSGSSITCSGGSRISQRRGRQPPRWRHQPIIWSKFSQKLHENERIWIQGGGGWGALPWRPPPLDPSMTWKGPIDLYLCHSHQAMPLELPLEMPLGNGYGTDLLAPTLSLGVNRPLDPPMTRLEILALLPTLYSHVLAIIFFNCIN